MAKFDYQCPTCKATLLDVQGPLGHPPDVVCRPCGISMRRYFGAMREMTINYGYRESRYPTQTDADIAKFQFTNL